MSVWITPRSALTMLGIRKLAQLTNEAGQLEVIGVGDAFETEFTTPFVFGSDLRVYLDGVIAGGYTAPIDYDDEERVVVHFSTAPNNDVQVAASSTDAVNTANLESAVSRAQGLVCGALRAQGYDIPTTATEPLLGWTAAIAWYLLASDPRRPRLLEAYPELERRYIDVYGGVDSDLKRVAKGTFSLRGVLSSATTEVGASQFVSDDVVFTAARFRGVL